MLRCVRVQAFLSLGWLCLEECGPIAVDAEFAVESLLYHVFLGFLFVSEDLKLLRGHLGKDSAWMTLWTDFVLRFAQALFLLWRRRGLCIISVAFLCGSLGS